MYAKSTLVYGIRRRAALLLVLVALVGALLPTAAFAAGSDATRLGSPQYITGRYQPRSHGYQRHGSHKQHSRHFCHTTYRVRKGDNLTKISRHFRVSIHSLMQANKIKNPNRIYAGQVLCIP